MQVKQQAGLQLKNLIKLYPSSWAELDPGTRTSIKESLLYSLRNREDCLAGLSQCIHAISELELPEATWPQLIPTLLEISVSSLPIPNKMRTMETVGYICETVSPDHVECHVNNLLTAIVGCISSRPSEADLTLSALTALYNALEFAACNFVRLSERNYLMQVRAVREGVKKPTFYGHVRKGGGSTLVRNFLLKSRCFFL